MSLSLSTMAFAHPSALTVPAESFLGSLLHPTSLLEGAGPWVLAVVALVVFIESGVLFPFLPGDSLLFTAGLLHTRLDISLPLLIGIIIVAAVAGDQVGYLLGRRYGRRWFTEDAKVLTTARLRAAEQFFARYGGRAVVLARFLPFVRTYTPLAAGMAHLPYRTFLVWNVTGAVVWGAGLTLLGSWLGGVEFIARNIDLILVLIVALSLLPAVWGMLRRRAKRTSPGAAATVPVESGLAPGNPGGGPAGGADR